MTQLRHLHLHTEYSLLDGMARIKKLIPRLKELGMDSMAITDHGTMYGVVDFYKQCTAQGIKPIIGLEAYVVPEMEGHERIKEIIAEHKKKRKKMKAKEKQEDNHPLTVKDYYNHLAANDPLYYGNSTTEIDDEGDIHYLFKPSHLLLLARNLEGYKNLIKIASESQLRGFYYKPRCDHELFEKYGKGIIATSACRGAEIPRLILRNKIEDAKQLALYYQEVFDEFYLEIQPSNNVDQRVINEALIKMSEEIKIPLVATSDAHYVLEEDSQKHEVLLAISTGTTMEDEDRFRFDEHVNFIMTEEEMLAYGIPQVAIDNTLQIAEKCNVELEIGGLYLPEAPKPSGYTARQYIYKLCMDGFRSKYRKWSKKERTKARVQAYMERLNYELDIIESKGYIDYFLIVADFIHYAQNNDVLVGPGRGSAAGCIVSYFLGITNLDPIKYDLLFERFLNPERNSMPDIDIDFMEYIEVPELFTSGRQQVIQYIYEKYGEDYICQILAMGTLATRVVLKDVGRALSIDHKIINDANKFVPMETGFQWNLSDCLYGDETKGREPVPQMVELAEKYPQLFDVAIELEGMPRHPSIHAAGVIICPSPVKDVLPLCRGGNDEIVSQFDKNLVEELGLLKMDLLGLRTLGVLYRTMQTIKEKHGIEIDLEDISFEDSGVLNVIKNGHTDGIFQVESNGFKDMFRQMDSVSFEDVIVALSLYRPGPMQFIPRYIACKNGQAEPQYLFPELAKVLENTYGIIVYQEQVIKIAVDLAGFSAGEGDSFRRAIGKKSEKLIKEQIDILIHGNDKIPGLLKKGVSLEAAEQLGLDIVEFSKYAFNRSHSAAYAVLTMQTGFFKTYYPKEYMTYLISSYIGKDDDKIVQYINEAKRMQINILPPDINKSEYEFSLEEEGIRYGLGAIKGLNKAAVQIILNRREKGNYKDVDDFLDRFGKNVVNKKAIDVLSLTGALHSLCPDIKRVDLLKHLYEKRGYVLEEDLIEKYIPEDMNLNRAKQLYSEAFKDKFLEEMTLLLVEQNLLGVYITSHPLKDKAEPILWDSLQEKERFNVVGITKSIKKILTKKQDDMAFAKIETLEGDRDITIFPREFSTFSGKILEEGGIRIFTLEKERRRDIPGEHSFIMKNIKYYRGESHDNQIDHQ